MDVIGTFWPADCPDKRVPGRLTFDPRNGGQLDLCGAFHDPKEVIATARAQQQGPVSVGLSELLGLGSPPIRILGDTTDGPVTLDQCLGDLSSYHVPLVFRGAHFLDNEPLLFQAAKFDILHLASWIGKSGLDACISSQQGSKQVEQICIINTPVADTIVDTQSGQLRLAFRYRQHGDRINELTIEQYCTLELRFADHGSVDDFFEAHGALQALIAIGVAAPVRVTDARVLTVAGHWIQVLAVGGSISSQPGEMPRIRPFDMLFTYDGLGGLSGIGRWLTMSKKFRPVTGILMSRWYEPDLYGELQFFNMVTAAETFARMRQRKQKFKFRFALEELSYHAGAPFQSVVAEVGTWAKRVVRTRDNHVVHRGLQGDADGESLYWLTASVYILVVLCLLRECEVPEENLPNPKTCPWMATVARKLRGDR